MEELKPDPFTIEIIDRIGDFLNDCREKEDRIKKLGELKDYLDFNLRLTELSDEELESYHRCHDGPVLSDEMRATLDSCKTGTQRKYYTEMWARALYIRRCEWDSYLYGETDEKPAITIKTEKVTPIVEPVT